VVFLQRTGHRPVADGRVVMPSSGRQGSAGRRVFCGQRVPLNGLQSTRSMCPWKWPGNSSAGTGRGTRAGPPTGSNGRS